MRLATGATHTFPSSPLIFLSFCSSSQLRRVFLSLPLIVPVVARLCTWRYRGLVSFLLSPCFCFSTAALVLTFYTQLLSSAAWKTWEKSGIPPLGHMFPARGGGDSVSTAAM